MSLIDKSVTLNGSTVIDYYGEHGVKLHKTHSLCRFMVQFADAYTLHKLSSDDDRDWMKSPDLFRMVGMKRDPYDRAVQLADLLSMHLIETYSPGSKGLWEYQHVKLTTQGGAFAKNVKQAEDYVIVIVSNGRSFPAPKIDALW